MFERSPTSDVPPYQYRHFTAGLNIWREEGHSASSQPGLGEYRNQMVSSRGGNVYNKPGGSLSYDYYEKGDEIFLYQRTFSVVKSPPNFLLFFQFFLFFYFFYSLLLFYLKLSIKDIESLKHSFNRYCLNKYFVQILR